MTILLSIWRNPKSHKRVGITTKSLIMSNFKMMSSVIATYRPQDGQTFRCSINFPHWDSPNGGKLKFDVIAPEGYPQPVFAIDHDKSGPDTRWYSDLFNGKIIEVNSQNGDPGGHSLYVGTTSDLPSGLNGDQSYTVVVSASKN